MISWYGSTLLIFASWDAFRNNPISFVVETTYKDWNTQFPSIAICEVENNDRIEEASDKYIYIYLIVNQNSVHISISNDNNFETLYSLWTKDHDFNLEEVLKEIAFYKGVSYYLFQFCSAQDSDPNCPKGNFTFYANTVVLYIFFLYMKNVNNFVMFIIKID